MITIAYSFHNMELLVESHSVAPSGEKLTVLEFVPVRLEQDELKEIDWEVML